MPTLVRVAKYRDETEHLNRLAHVDYHACVSVSEVETWKETAALVLAQVEGMTCNRASAYDRDQFAKAIDALQSQLIAADTRIAQLQSKTEIARGYARWADAIIGRMIVENARDLSDAEIERTLAPCVCGPRLIEVAKAMRDCGTLTLASLKVQQ